MLIKYNKLMLHLILVWLIISSVYYIQAVFIGVGALQYGENIYHKIIKYSMCVFLSFSLLLWKNKFHVLLLALVFFIFATFSYIDSEEVTVFATTMLIIGTMIGFVYLIPVYHYEITKINYVLLWTGVIIGIVSILELTIFYQNMVSYWSSTGGVRSISSLLNPTNSGAYAAVIIILALTTNIKRTFLKILFIIMPLITLILSGSRTAWLSLGIVMALSPLIRGKASKKLRKVLPLFILLGIASAIIYIYFLATAFSGIDSQYRGLNSYTASIRLVNFLNYFKMLDISMILPDFNDKNIAFISDNFYLVMLNFLGIIGFSLLLLCIMILFFLNQSANKIEGILSSELTGWKVIFIYFAISGLSNSFINAFPVNQLFFISCGYFIHKMKVHKYY